jgi:hypothetical protein
MNSKRKRIVRLGLIGVAGGAAICLAAGCQNDKHDHAIHGELFPPDEQVRPVDRAVDVQAAAAARNDATLYSYHFDRSAALNSLGKAKLDLMLRDDDDASPLVVYLDLRGPADTRDGNDRQGQAVRHYLADRGVAEAQLELRSGPNVDYTSPARDGLRGLHKLDGDQAPADAAPPTTMMTLTGDQPKK